MPNTEKQEPGIIKRLKKDAETAADKKAENDKDAQALKKWLKEQGAGDHVGKFLTKGYTRIKDLDEDALEEVIPEQPGIRKRLLNELKEKPPRSIPELPEGIPFDLSAPKVKAPDDSIIKFEIPNALSVTATETAVKSPAEITHGDWLIIAKNSNLLYGFDMSGPEPWRARSPVLWWKTPADGIDFITAQHLESHSKSVLVYTENTDQYVRHGFDTETASLGFLFAAASFERSHEEKRARSSARKTLYMRGMWVYPRAQIHLDRCSAVSPDFVKEITGALGSADKLAQVFKDFGHAVALEPTLGGQLVFEKRQEATGVVDETETKLTIRYAVDFMVKGVTGGQGLSWGEAQKTKTAAKALSEEVLFNAVGGNTLLGTNPKDWAPTVAEPKLWAVIERRRVVPTYELLDEALKNRVLEVWATVVPLLGKPEVLPWVEGWGRIQRSPTSGFVIAMRDASKSRDGSIKTGNRGSVFVASGPGADPEEGDPKAAAGAAFVHYDPPGDAHYECNSVCLPVPKNGTYRCKFEASQGDPTGRLAFVSSKLDFGEWNPVFDSFSNKPTEGTKVGGSWVAPTPAEKDGFLFVSIDAQNDCSRGIVYVTIGKEPVSGCSVQRDSNLGKFLYRTSLCIPVPARSTYSIEWEDMDYDPTKGDKFPRVRAYLMPVVGRGVKMEKAESRELWCAYPATTDGILHGWVWVAKDGQRGMLKLYTFDVDAERAKNPKALTEQEEPYAGASVHFGGKWKLAKANSVMLPVRQGAHYAALLDIGDSQAGSPVWKLFWTAIVPG